MTSPGRLTVLTLLTLLAAAAATSSAFAQENGARTLEGVWGMTLTLRDCATGMPLGPPFRSLLTFHAGGAVSESPGTTQFAPGQRSTGHGAWTRSGPGTFTSRFVAMILFDTPPAPPAPGFQAGWQVITANYTMPHPDLLSLSATAQFFDMNRQLYRSACPTGMAERFR